LKRKIDRESSDISRTKSENMMIDDI